MPCEYLRRHWRVGDELETYNEHTHAWRRARVIEVLGGNRGRVRYLGTGAHDVIALPPMRQGGTWSDDDDDDDASATEDEEPFLWTRHRSYSPDERDVAALLDAMMTVV